MTSRPISDLDDLFGESIQAGRAAGVFRTVKNAALEAKKVVRTSELYSLPEYWIPGRIIALIHEESKTLLGVFQEFNHKREKGARKLERIAGPAIPVSKEYVSGDWWLGDNRKPIVLPESWGAVRELCLPDLILQQMEVHAEAVAVRVCLQFGGILRVELLSHTTFHSPTADKVLTIPAGTNILECLSLEAKIQLRKELA